MLAVAVLIEAVVAAAALVLVVRCGIEADCITVTVQPLSS